MLLRIIVILRQFLWQICHVALNFYKSVFHFVFFLSQIGFAINFPISLCLSLLQFTRVSVYLQALVPLYHWLELYNKKCDILHSKRFAFDQVNDLNDPHKMYLWQKILPLSNTISIYGGIFLAKWYIICKTLQKVHHHFIKSWYSTLCCSEMTAVVNLMWIYVIIQIILMIWSF